MIVGHGDTRMRERLIISRSQRGPIVQHVQDGQLPGKGDLAYLLYVQALASGVMEHNLRVAVY